MSIDLSSLLPHGKPLSLIEEVLKWNEDSIVAKTMSHTYSDNPLLNNGLLHPMHSLEYAAQVMAIHSGLLNENKKARTMLIGGLRKLSFSSTPLNKYLEPLTIMAKTQIHSSSGAIYQFSIMCSESQISQGRIILVRQQQPLGKQDDEHSNS